MSAWGVQFNCKGKIRMLADPSAAFTKAIDLSLELPPLGENLTQQLEIKTNLFVFLRWNQKQALLDGH